VTLLLDPVAPPPDAADFWARIDADPPDAVVVLKPDHVRDVDLFARRYGTRAFGPPMFHRQDVPRTELAPIAEGTELPGGPLGLHEGHGHQETPLWCPRQQVLVFADALTAPESVGRLMVRESPLYERRVLPALRELLALPFRHVIVSHGAPVHDRAEFERALQQPPWDEG
jgi:hypothetical protein